MYHDQDKYFTFSGDSTGSAQPVEVTESAEGKRTLSGYAVVWGAISTQRPDGYRYRFDRGSIQWESEVLALWSHDPSRPLASTSNGSLRLSEDDIGVKVEMDLADTTAGRDAYELVRSRLVRGMSFGGPIASMRFETINQHLRRVTAFSGKETTITPIPAMRETAIAVAASDDEQKNLAALKESAAKLQKSKLDTLKLRNLGHSIRA